MRRLFAQPRALVDPPFIEQRGSIEETQRILREIERINIAMGYRKKQEVAFPRTSNFNEGYFYPRPVYQPLNFRTTTMSPAAPVPMFKQFTGERLVSTVDPFRAQVYYYPAPYLRVPMVDGPRAFQSGEVLEIKRSKELSPKIFVLPIAVPSADGRSSEVRYIPSTVNFGSLQGFRSRGKAMEDEERKVKKGKGMVEDMAEVVEEDKVDEDLLEEVLDAVDYDLDDDEDEKQQVLPVTEKFANDKFMNSKLTDSSEENSDEQADLEVMMLNKGVRGTSRSFNITATFQNFTNRFIPSSTPTTTLEPSDIKELQQLDFSETSDATAPQAELEQEKGPFGLFNRQTDPGNGGIVIQRLRVRQGGIAIAGPGGIATAGSGGTAIVGPNGTAITHPRSLTIAGPGAKIYAVPESVDLGKTINATKRSLPLDAVLVANGPVVYYRN